MFVDFVLTGLDLRCLLLLWFVFTLDLNVVWVMMFVFGCICSTVLGLMLF